MKKRILIEAILTKQCNKRCAYCVLQFSHATLSQERLAHLARLIQDTEVEVTINFFGGEPLLEFPSIVNLLEQERQSSVRFTL